MEKKGVCDDDIKLSDQINPDQPYCSEMETETIASSQKNEGGDGSNVVFSREAPLIGKDPAGTNSGECSGCIAKKLNFKGSEDLIEKESIGQQKKLNRQDRIELGRLFQGAVTSLDWELAERLIQLADPQTLNDLLCVGLDSVWFLSTKHEFQGVTGLIKKIICHGAHDFTRATLRTSFLAACVSACQSRTMSLADTVTVMAQRYTSDSLINFWFA
uniref:Ankyrin repeat protein SKIP35 n=1 Tax=Noccaea caerulescens TaxID=107243 RepID=A0A1J3JH82_NOCCA